MLLTTTDCKTAKILLYTTVINVSLMYRVITRFIAQGVDQEACTAQGKAECCIRIETPPRVQ